VCLISIRCQSVFLCSAYAVNLFSYDLHMLSIYNRMLSTSRNRAKTLGNWYPYALHTPSICTRMLSIRSQFVPVSPSCTFNLYLYAEQTKSICTCMLSKHSLIIIIKTLPKVVNMHSFHQWVSHQGFWHMKWTEKEFSTSLANNIFGYR